MNCPFSKWQLPCKRKQFFKKAWNKLGRGVSVAWPHSADRSRQVEHPLSFPTASLTWLFWTSMCLLQQDAAGDGCSQVPYLWKSLLTRVVCVLETYSFLPFQESKLLKAGRNSHVKVVIIFYCFLMTADRKRKKKRSLVEIVVEIVIREITERKTQITIPSLCSHTSPVEYVLRRFVPQTN